jgi:glycosyltransferase involved in cell wall biosynthesis
VGKAGIVFRNKDVDDLERQIRWVLSNPESVLERGALGRFRALSLFSWERVVDQLETLYRRLLHTVPSYAADPIASRPAIRPEV